MSVVLPILIQGLFLLVGCIGRYHFLPQNSQNICSEHLKISPESFAWLRKVVSETAMYPFHQKEIFYFYFIFFQNKWWYIVLSWLVMSPTNVTEPSLRKRTFEIFRNLLVKKVSIHASSRAEVLIIWNVWID